MADEAMKGVPNAEKEEYWQSREDCWRCSRGGHKTYESLAFNTRRGTPLPAAPWKASAVGEGKRKSSEEPKQPPATKQEKVAAEETIDTNLMPWEDSGSDF